MRELASDLARRLAQNAEAVCRHYLSNGRRHGRYWLVGDVENAKGRSLYVRLTGPESGKGAAGKWTDAATGEHGDLLDLIAANQRLTDLPQVLDEARRFLSRPGPEPTTREPLPAVPTGSPEAARRLLAMSKPIQGTLAASYLRARDILEERGRDGPAPRALVACGRSAVKDGEGRLSCPARSRVAAGKKVGRSRCRPGPAPVRSPLSEGRRRGSPVPVHPPVPSTRTATRPRSSAPPLPAP